MEETTAYQPTLLRAATRYRWLIVATAAAFALAGLLAALVLFNDWVGESAILIENPSASHVFDTGSPMQPERFLASQVAILESAELAEFARRLVADPDVSLEDVLNSRQILASRDTDLIRISYASGDPETSVAFANAFGLAYRDYRERTTNESFELAISGLVSSIAALDQELAEVDAAIVELSPAEGNGDLERQLADAVDQFLQSAGDPESTAQLESLLNQLQTLQIIRSLQAQNPELALLLSTRADLVDRRTRLIVRQDELRVDSALASTGVAAFSESAEATRSITPTRAAAAGLILGALAGVGLAYLLSYRYRRFSDRAEPEAALGITLLGEVPRFDTTGPEGSLPVLNEPRSPSAEAFRFVGNGLTARIRRLAARSEEPPKRMIGFTSALLGDGKTMVTVNTGLSVATRGKSVLLIDGDFGDQALTRLLRDETADSLQGITDIVEGSASIQDVVMPVDLGRGHRVDLLTRGSVEINAADFFRSAVTYELFRLIRAIYDYVLVDIPPLLQVSYAANLVSLTDGVVAVIPHESKESMQRDLIHRLDLLGSECIGYVYNKAPLRPEMLEQRGSMRDPLGSLPPT